jgi:hypothetical protein
MEEPKIQKRVGTKLTKFKNYDQLVQKSSF